MIPYWAFDIIAYATAHLWVEIERVTQLPPPVRVRFDLDA